MLLVLKYLFVILNVVKDLIKSISIRAVIQINLFMDKNTPNWKAGPMGGYTTVKTNLFSQNLIILTHKKAIR
ncbi:MAG: hypothetical protein JWP71_779 [Mucilaginibacter sp.]|nr:hypothetical protein [Mucilaginibacter sp.]